VGEIYGGAKVLGNELFCPICGTQVDYDCYHHRFECLSKSCHWQSENNPEIGDYVPVVSQIIKKR